MATVGGAYKLDSAISGGGTRTSDGTTTCYTATSTTFGIVTISFYHTSNGTSGTATINVGGRVVYQKDITTGASSSGTPAFYLASVYVGPSQTVTLVTSSFGGSPSCFISCAGVQFVNS